MLVAIGEDGGGWWCGGWFHALMRWTFSDRAATSAPLCLEIPVTMSTTWYLQVYTGGTHGKNK
jgi:hypothetical protein